MSFQTSSSKLFSRPENVSFCLLTYANENRNQNLFNDIIIKTENGENISANRMVLSCYSKYFEKMFKSQMKEQTQQSINVKGVKGESLKLLIDYIYSGQICVTSDNVVSLLSAADYLQLDKVKDFCVEFIRFEIKTENCLKILMMADIYRTPLLKNEVFKYINQNHEKIIKNQVHKYLSKVDFISCVSLFNQHAMNQNLLCQLILDWIKYDRETRKDELFQLLPLVNFEKLSIDFLKSVVSDDVIYEDKVCAKLVNCHLLEIIQKRFSSEKESKIVSLGGGWSEKRVAEVYNLSNHSSVAYPDLPDPLQSHCALKTNNYIYCIGGYCKYVAKNSVRRLDISEENLKWEEVASMSFNRSSFGASYLNEFIVVSGGCNENSEQLAWTEAYAIATNRWKTIASLKQKRRANKLVTCQGCLYSLGGFDGKRYTASVEKLFDLNSEWNDVASMQTERCYFAAVSCDGFIYAIGGVRSNFCDLKTVEKYDPRLNSWTYVSSMNIAKYDHSACVLHGKIFVVGGCNNEIGALKEIECYIPSLDKWFIVSESEGILRDHSLIVL